MDQEHDQGHCGTGDHDHGRTRRREFLRRSLGALIGIGAASPMVGILTGDPRVSGFSSLWAADPLAEPAQQARRVRSIILLWMDGGPPHLDTFDPKPGSANAGPFKAIPTALPEVRICEHLPRVASIADRLCIIRSMTTGEGNHSRAKHYMRTGYKPAGTVRFPGMGAIAAEEIGNPGISIPLNIAINAPGAGAGFLGVRYDPFYVPEAGKPVANLALPPGVTPDRFERRLSLLAGQQSRFSAALGSAGDDIENYSRINQSARAFMDAPQAKAFDISPEPAAVKSAYGDSRFGRGCLMARRLVEAGVNFVEVSLNGWDTHVDNFTRVESLLGDVDPAMHALITDLEQRNLLDTTLIVWMGEFGRTPKVNGNEGRDHFPNAWNVVLAGGGVRPGVIGATSDDGTRVVSNVVRTEDLFRTIYTIAGIDPEKTFATDSGRPIKVANGGSVIPGVLPG